jgi:hypothetical protein
LGYTSIVSEQRNLVAQEADLGDFDRLDKELGLKRRLSEVCARRDIFERLAEANHELEGSILGDQLCANIQEGGVLESAWAVELDELKTFSMNDIGNGVLNQQRSS